jgi:hypothetical protein
MVFLLNLQNCIQSLTLAEEQFGFGKVAVLVDFRRQKSALRCGC